MPAAVDLSGCYFGRLLVAAKAGRRGSDTCWICVCLCGREVVVARGNLRNGSTRSCGCIRNVQHGLSRKHPLWRRWSRMLSRCNSSTDKDYHNYGARGIAVCERWLTFPNFVEDMEASYFAGATLEREDNDGPYDPENVKWATRHQQCWNQRHTRYIDTPWGRLSRGEAAKRAGIEISRFNRRVIMGWSTERLFDPANRGKMNRWSRRSSHA